MGGVSINKRTLHVKLLDLIINEIFPIATDTKETGAGSLVHENVDEIVTSNAPTPMFDLTSLNPVTTFNRSGITPIHQPFTIVSSDRMPTQPRGPFIFLFPRVGMTNHGDMSK
jgi:hypothetical protein